VKKLLLITFLSLCFAFQMYAESLADEKTVTVTEFTNTVKQIPSNVSNWATNEWTDIKEYQKASWQAGKEQNAKNLAKIKSFFANLTKGND